MDILAGLGTFGALGGFGVFGVDKGWPSGQPIDGKGFGKDFGKNFGKGKGNPFGKSSWFVDDRDPTNQGPLPWNIDGCCFDFHFKEGCIEGKNCPQSYSHKCPVRGCHMIHRFSDAHPELHIPWQKFKGKFHGKGGKDSFATRPKGKGKKD